MSIFNFKEDKDKIFKNVENVLDNIYNEKDEKKTKEKIKMLKIGIKMVKENLSLSEGVKITDALNNKISKM